MKQRKEQVRQAFAQRMTYASDLHHTGAKNEVLLSKLYCRFLPHTAEKEGDWMARHVLDQIRQFDTSQKRLQEMESCPEEERLALLGEEIIGRMEGFVVTSQCRKLHSLNQAMTALDDLFQGTCTPEEAAGMIPAGYRGNTGEKGRNGELRKVLENIFVTLEKTQIQRGAETVVGSLRRDWMDDTLYRAILTIALYTMMVEGAWAPDLADLPVSIEYIAVAVCSLTSVELDHGAIKMFLLAGFLAAGTATVMFIGSAVSIYAAYFLTTRTVGEFILFASGTEK